MLANTYSELKPYQKIYLAILDKEIQLIKEDNDLGKQIASLLNYQNPEFYTKIRNDYDEDYKKLCNDQYNPTDFFNKYAPENIDLEEVEKFCSGLNQRLDTFISQTPDTDTITKEIKSYCKDTDKPILKDEEIAQVIQTLMNLITK